MDGGIRAALLQASAQQPDDPLGGGLAPMGIRHSGQGVKGRGYFGLLPHSGGSVSSELSSEFDYNGAPVEHPLLVPSLDANELKHLLSGAEPTPEIYQKAQDHAIMRMKAGKNPFAGPGDLQIPAPQ